MGIMCINTEATGGRKHPCLDYGAIYTATGETKNKLGEDCYIIPELPNSGNPYLGVSNNMPIYRKVRFIPLSNIDETEMERNYNELLTTK